MQGCGRPRVTSTLRSARKRAASGHLALGLLAVLGSASIGSPRHAYAGAKSAPEAVIALETLPGAGAGLRASVGGHEAVFLFDTGEGISTVTPAFASQIGCKPWGQTTGFRMSGERLDLRRCDNLRLTLAEKPFTAIVVVCIGAKIGAILAMVRCAAAGISHPPDGNSNSLFTVTLMAPCSRWICI